MRLKIILLFLLFTLIVSAQKTVKLCGEYIYHAPENVSPEQAKKTALERAQLQALADEFGTTVSQQNTTSVRNENGKSDVSFLSLGGSEVKGEWLETTKVPEYKISFEQGMLVVAVSVCGKAREITGAGVDFSAKVLRNGTEEKFESTDFHDGDDMFLLFRSPADGYLAVYLVDVEQTAFCLLPYGNNTNGKVFVKAGKDYIFFSAKHAEQDDKQAVTEYSLTAEKAVEHNQLYVVFSPNEFTKANDGQASEQTMPRELSFADFQKWLSRNKIRDKKLKEKIINLTIKK